MKNLVSDDSFPVFFSVLWHLTMPTAFRFGHSALPSSHLIFVQGI